MPIAKEKLEMQLLLLYEDLEQLEVTLVKERAHEAQFKMNELFKTSRTVQYRITVLRKKIKILERGWNVYVNKYQMWQEQDIVLESAVSDLDTRIQDIHTRLLHFDAVMAPLPEQDVRRIVLTLEKIECGKPLPKLEKEYKRAVTQLLAHRDKKVYPAAPLSLDSELVLAASGYVAKKDMLPDSPKITEIINAAESPVRADFNSTDMLNTSVDWDVLRGKKRPVIDFGDE